MKMAMASSPAALILAVLFAVGSVTIKETFPNEQAAQQAAAGTPAESAPLTDQQKADLEKWWALQPKVDVPVPDDGVKVLMVKFNDYQCPPCRQTFEAYGPLIEKWTKTGQFKFVLKHFPLDAECNGAAPNTPHPAACEAAAAIVMARRKNDGSADKLEHWLFSHQTPLLTPDQVKDAARDVAGITDFQAKYDGALLEVRNDAGMGVMLGVKSTPTFFINGRILPGGYDPRLIDAVIDLEMKRAK
jgi:protein-disulfide isomerase